jgi:S1-C subfamily serine protease
MSNRVLRPLALMGLFVLLVSLACNIGSNPMPTSAPTSEQATQVEATQPTGPTSATAARGAAVSSLDDLQSAVIQIEAEGTFIDPEVGLVVNGAGRGSGFIIDPAGIAITNNHVVTGAGLLRVWVGGESKPRNAKVLGVSECSDLAVIDINGDGFPYLEWHEATPKVGLDVYAAGFPLGEPQFTLTRGVVSKASADGQTSWASVDNVLEHDAKINPGNSGGPLVDKDGRVVGVNYASRGSTDQSYAIAYAEVESLINDLKAGRYFDRRERLGGPIGGWTDIGHLGGFGEIRLASGQSWRKTRRHHHPARGPCPGNRWDDERLLQRPAHPQFGGHALPDGLALVQPGSARGPVERPPIGGELQLLQRSVGL